MSIYKKVAFMACGVAIVSSAITVVAVNSFTAGDNSQSYTLSENGMNTDGNIYKVSHNVTPPTDFTHAAESTINGVVSIKSYATPRGYNYGGGQASPFSDPLFDFFFGTPNNGNRRQQPQQREKSEQQMGL